MFSQQDIGISGNFGIPARNQMKSPDGDADVTDGVTDGTDGGVMVGSSLPLTLISKLDHTYSTDSSASVLTVFKQDKIFSISRLKSLQRSFCDFMRCTMLLTVL